MTKILLIAFSVCFWAAYIYFGYYQDYKRNPKGFLRILIAMPLGIVYLIFGMRSENRKLKKWANHSEDDNKKPNA